MDSIENIKKSVKMVWAHKFLWGLGVVALLAAGSGGGGNVGNFGNMVPGSSRDGDEVRETAAPAAVADSGEEADAETASPADSGEKEASTGAEIAIPAKIDAKEYAYIIGAICLGVIGFIALILVMGYAGNAAKAGLMISVGRIDAGEPTAGYREAYRAGKPLAWRLFGQGILASLVFLVPMLAMLAVGGAIAYGVYATKNIVLAIGAAVTLLPIAAILLILLGIITQILTMLAPAASVFKGEKAWAGVKYAFGLIKKHPGKVAVAWLVQLAAGIVAGIGTLILILAALLILSPFGLLIYVLGQIQNPAVGIPAVAAAILILFVLMLAVQGFINAVFVSFWTLTFRELPDPETPDA